MSTQSKILANRLNAQKSTGPNTPQGKAIVSQNALKHGLSARCDVVITESQADFDLHRDALLAELDPISPMESILADRIVSLSWRLKRADLIQNQTIDAMNEKNTINPLANLAKSFGLKGLGIPQSETLDSNPDLTLGRIALKDFSNARVLDRLLMYERRIEHSLYKTTLELQRLHLLRSLDPPIPHSQHNLAPGFTGGSPQKSSENPASAIQNPASAIQNPASSIENPASRIENQESRPNYAKQTQFPQGQNQRNLLCRKELCKKTAPVHSKRTNPIKANSPNAIRDTQHAIRKTNPIYRGEASGEAGSNPITPRRRDEILP